jgi:hypothetical protein
MIEMTKFLKVVALRSRGTPKDGTPKGGTGVSPVGEKLLYSQHRCPADANMKTEIESFETLSSAVSLLNGRVRIPLRGTTQRRI